MPRLDGADRVKNLMHVIYSADDNRPPMFLPVRIRSRQRALMARQLDPARFQVLEHCHGLLRKTDRWWKYAETDVAHLLFGAHCVGTVAALGTLSNAEEPTLMVPGEGEIQTQPYLHLFSRELSAIRMQTLRATCATVPVSMAFDTLPFPTPPGFETGVGTLLALTMAWRVIHRTERLKRKLRKGVVHVLSSPALVKASEELHVGNNGPAMDSLGTRHTEDGQPPCWDLPPEHYLLGALMQELGRDSYWTRVKYHGSPALRNLRSILEQWGKGGLPCP